MTRFTVAQASASLLRTEPSYNMVSAAVLTPYDDNCAKLTHPTSVFCIQAYSKMQGRR